MKKIFKWFRIIVVAVLAFLLIGFVAIPLIFPVNKIKDLAAAKLSATLGREVRIAKVSFNLWTGIKLEKIAIANRQGFSNEPFVRADALTLRYAFWPLFQRHIIVQEISLDKPEILIEKNYTGEFNFSDLIRAQKNTPTKTTVQKDAPNKAKDLGFSLVVDAFAVRNGRISYIDHDNNSGSQLNEIALSLSGITLVMLKPVSFSLTAQANYQGKTIPLSLAGQIALNLSDEKINLPALTLGIAGEKATITAQATNLSHGPEIDFSLTSSQLGIDPLLAIFAASTPTKEKKRVDLNKTINQFTALVPSKLRIQGHFDVSNLTCLNFKVDKALLNVALTDKKVAVEIKEVKIYNGTLTGQADFDLRVPGLGYAGELKLTGFNAAPFSNAVVPTFLTTLPDYQNLINKIYGTLDVSIVVQGRGISSVDFLANSAASGSFSLRNGELKRLKTIDALAEKLKTSALKQDIKVSELSSGFAYKNQILMLKHLILRDHDLGLLFSGGLDLRQKHYLAGNRLTLKGSPSLTRELPKEFAVFKDEKGWLSMEFELRGELKKPVPIPQLNKPFEAVVGKFKVKVEAKKVEIEQAVNAQVSAEADRLKQEAKKQIDDLLKNNFP
ncbi:AsmA family protein [Candidatus Saganbacteria bacterium]|nr:AsmA family protein [Candidatus Saganbacteria bacterium]